MTFMQRYAAALPWIGFALLCLALEALLLLFPSDELGRPLWYKLAHLAEITFLIGLVMGACARLSGPTRSAAGLILLGLALSFLGDFINSYIFDLSPILSPQTLLSIPFFAAAHLLYCYAFYRLGGQDIRRATQLVSLLLWPLLAVGLWLLVVGEDAKPLLKWASLGYSLVIVLMLIQACWLFVVARKASFWVVLAAISFMVSDALLGSYISMGDQRPLWVSQLIWISYLLGQLGIAATPLLVKGRGQV